MTPFPPDEQTSPATFEEPSFENNVDFIAFKPEPPEHYSNGEDDEPRVGDRDRYTEKSREHNVGDGKKRKLDYDRDDGYNNKERTDAASRKAPWVTDVDWEGSTNVAELYVLSPRRCMTTDGILYT